MCQEQLEIGDFKVLRCSGGRKVSGGCLEFTTKLSRGCMNASMVSGVCLGVFRRQWGMSWSCLNKIMVSGVCL